MIPPIKVVIPDKELVLQDIGNVLASGMLTLGKHGEAFENAFLGNHGGKYAIATSSGTSALEILLRCANVEGGEVILPTNTFAATAFAIVHAGARPVFVDIENDGLGLDLLDVEDVVNENTKAVVTVHIGGIISPRMQKLQSLCKTLDIALIEDAAHAHGCALNEQIAGTFGIGGSFSFYPTKVVTSGEGGMILTDSEAIRDRARIFRDQGKAGFTTNHHTEMGHNWRLSELHAVVGKYHMRQLSRMVRERTAAAEFYNAGLENIKGITAVKVPPSCTCNYYKYMAILDDRYERDVFKKKLRDLDVRLAGEVYDLPLHKQPVFGNPFDATDRNPNHINKKYPVAEKFCDQHVCLPLWDGMHEVEQLQVINTIEKVLK